MPAKGGLARSPPTATPQPSVLMLEQQSARIARDESPPKTFASSSASHIIMDVDGTPLKTNSLPGRVPSAPKVVKPASSQIVSTPKGTSRTIGNRPASDFLRRIDEGSLTSTLADILVLTKTLLNDNLQMKSELANIKELLHNLVRTTDDPLLPAVHPPAVPTYASVAKTKTNGKVLIIKPVADKLNPAESRSLINSKLKPSKYQLRGISSTQNGGVIVELPSSAEREKLKTDAVTNLGDNFVVSTPIGSRPRIRLFGFTVEYNAVDLVNILKEQNASVMSDNTHISVIHIFQSKKNKRFGAFLQVDSRTFNKMIAVDKIFIGWDSCQANEDLNIRRCYKCWGFNHVSSKCSADLQKCPLCCGNHHQNECDSSIEKCAVCSDVVAKNHLNIDTNHSVFSKNCPSYLHRIAQERRKIDYGE